MVMRTLDNTLSSRRARAPLFVAVVALTLAFAGIYFWRVARVSGAAQIYAPPPVEAATETVHLQRLPQYIEAIGSLEAVREVTLAPELPGRVTAVRFEAGSQVAAGTVLVELYDAPERADRGAALARVGLARAQLGRARELASAGAQSLQVLDQRKTELDEAEAAIRQLDARIAQKTIRAPFSGTIGIRRVNLGQYVNAGDALATLTALERLYVNFSVPQQELAKLHLGGDVVVRTDAYPARSFSAQINAIEPKVGSDTRNVSVQATLANTDQSLRPGLYVTASVMLPERPDSALIPSTAIQTSASGDMVFVVREGKAQVLPVTTGQHIGDRVVIERGIAAGDVIITSGQLRIQPGGPVKSVAAISAADASKSP